MKLLIDTAKFLAVLTVGFLATLGFLVTADVILSYR